MPAPALPVVAAHEPPRSGDRPRPAGLRGDQFTLGVLLLGVVFLLGFGILAFVLLSRRKPDSPGK